MTVIKYCLLLLVLAVFICIGYFFYDEGKHETNTGITPSETVESGSSTESASIQMGGGGEVTQSPKDNSSIGDTVYNVLLDASLKSFYDEQGLTEEDIIDMNNKGYNKSNYVIDANNPFFYETNIDYLLQMAGEGDENALAVVIYRLNPQVRSSFMDVEDIQSPEYFNPEYLDQKDKILNDQRESFFAEKELFAASFANYDESALTEKYFEAQMLSLAQGNYLNFQSVPNENLDGNMIALMVKAKDGDRYASALLKSSLNRKEYTDEQKSEAQKVADNVYDDVLALRQKLASNSAK